MESCVFKGGLLDWIPPFGRVSADCHGQSNHKHLEENLPLPRPLPRRRAGEGGLPQQGAAPLLALVPHPPPPPRHRPGRPLQARARRLPHFLSRPHPPRPIRHLLPPQAIPQTQPPRPLARRFPIPRQGTRLAGRIARLAAPRPRNPLVRRCQVVNKIDSCFPEFSDLIIAER